jgi:hypothetical protein
MASIGGRNTQHATSNSYSASRSGKPPAYRWNEFENSCMTSQTTYHQSGNPAGSIEVWSRLTVARGIELNVEAGASGLSPEELRTFFRKVMAACQETKNTKSEGNGDE